MRKFVCLYTLPEEVWLTVGNVYVVEDDQIDKYFPAADWIRIKVADDKFPCYARRNQFKQVREDYNESV